MTSLILIHSPFVGADAWDGVADALRGEGWTVAVPSLLEGLKGHEPYMPKFVEAIWQEVPTEGAVLIAHSGAGALIPSAITAAPVPVEAVILVDALVAKAGVSWRDEAPAELTERLDAFTDCGLLPEWNRWFSAKLLREILPDEDMCESFIESLPRVPASYLDERIPNAANWPPARGGFLQLSDAYDEEARKAENLGWLRATLPSDHLAMLTRPDDVAEALGDLLGRLNIEP